MKCAVAPTATTISFAAELKKAVPLNVSLRLDTWITEISAVREAADSLRMLLTCPSRQQCATGELPAAASAASAVEA